MAIRDEPKKQLGQKDRVIYVIYIIQINEYVQVRVKNGVMICDAHKSDDNFGNCQYSYCRRNCGIRNM